MNFKLLLLTLSLFVVACNPSSDSETEAKKYYYVPKIPFGNIDNSTIVVRSVKNLQVDLTELEKAKFTWKIPPIYKTIPHQILIFKRRDPPTDFELPPPSEESSGATFFLKKTVGVQTTGAWTDENTIISPGVDDNSIEQDVNYSYWFFIRLGENEGDPLSEGVRIDFKTPKEENIFVFPTAVDFWKKLSWNYGLEPAYGPPTIQPVSLHSLNGGLAGPAYDRTQLIGPYDPLPPKIDPVIPGNPRGGIAFAKGGNIMFVADTNSNRIVIYQRREALGCEAMINDEALYSACMINAAGSPLVPTNVLGQPKVSPQNPKGYFDCGETGSLPNHSCMNRPTKVMVYEVGSTEYLFVADSGNDRILVYNRLPIQGCDANAIPSVTQPTDCEPTFVIGKQSLDDLTSYTVASSGNSSLNYPTDMFLKDNDLYIADTGNNRVVKLKDVIGINKTYDCTPTNWQTSLCRWSSVLGQPNFFTSDYFANMVANDNTLVGGTLNDEVSNATLLAKYFRAPTRIYITENDELLVGANEAYEGSSPLGTAVKMYGRILIWNTNPIKGGSPICNEATFGTGSCDANEVIGQTDFDKLIIQSSGSYNTTSYAIESIGDFDLLNGKLIATDTMNNTIYFWDDWKTETANGNPPTYRITDPEGAYNPDTSRNLPDLETISAIRAVPGSNLIYVADPPKHQIYQIRGFNLPGLE